MYATFYYSDNFNQPLVWDTSKVTNMAGTFEFAGAFNQPLDWDTSSVRALEKTFFGASTFNQPLAISRWDVSKVTLMESLFADSVKGMSGMFTNTALASDDCSKQVMHEAWKDVAAFNSTYSSWKDIVGCPPSAPPPPGPQSPPPSPPPAPPPAPRPEGRRVLPGRPAEALPQGGRRDRRPAAQGGRVADRSQPHAIAEKQGPRDWEMGWWGGGGVGGG